MSNYSFSGAADRSRGSPPRGVGQEAGRRPVVVVGEETGHRGRAAGVVELLQDDGLEPRLAQARDLHLEVTGQAVVEFAISCSVTFTSSTCTVAFSVFKSSSVDRLVEGFDGPVGAGVAHPQAKSEKNGRGEDSLPAVVSSSDAPVPRLVVTLLGSELL